MTDDPTYCCDVPECQVPVVLSALVRVGKEHWCRSCYERLHPPVKVVALTPVCCTEGCTGPAYWRVRFSPQLEDYTECCDAHLHATLGEGNPMRTLILRIDAPLMEGVDYGQPFEPDTEKVQ